MKKLRPKVKEPEFWVPLSFVEKFVAKPLSDALSESSKIPYRADDWGAWQKMREKLRNIHDALVETKKLASFCSKKRRSM